MDHQAVRQALASIGNVAGGMVRPLVDFALPPACLACGAAVASGPVGGLCAACFRAITFLSEGPDLCPCCGLPRDMALDPAEVCPECRQRPPPWGRARAALLYDSTSRALVLRFKHADRGEGLAAFAGWMARAGAPILAEADLLVPVPLHRWRLFSRRFNQAALLAGAIGKRCGMAVGPDVLRRTRATASQGHGSRGRRGSNVRGAFAVARPGLVTRRRVVVIDDVLTTGATVGECARALWEAGADAVDVLTLARVPLDWG